MKKLSSYLSAGIAATATFQSSEAATVVTLYGPGARTPSTSPATPVGIHFGTVDSGVYQFIDINSQSVFASTSRGSFISNGTNNLKITAGITKGLFYNYSFFVNGAQRGSSNYANISFNGNDNVYEAVGQFHLDSVGGYLIALAINDDNSALSISAGKAAIDAVPEPSAIALLALGAGGMAMRRRRKVA